MPLRIIFKLFKNTHCPKNIFISYTGGEWELFIEMISIVWTVFKCIVQNQLQALRSLNFNHKFNNNALIERDNFPLQLFSNHYCSSLGGFDNSVELRVVSILDCVFGSIVFLIHHARNCLDGLFWVWDFRWFWVCIFQFWGEEISQQQKQLWPRDQDFWYSLQYLRRPPYNSCIAPVWWGRRTVCSILAVWVFRPRWTCLCGWHSQIFCCNREGWHRLWSNWVLICLRHTLFYKMEFFVDEDEHPQ